MGLLLMFVISTLFCGIVRIVSVVKLRHIKISINVTIVVLSRVSQFRKQCKPCQGKCFVVSFCLSLLRVVILKRGYVKDMYGMQTIPLPHPTRQAVGKTGGGVEHILCSTLNQALLRHAPPETHLSRTVQACLVGMALSLKSPLP
jgi:hypothetical protein